MTSIRVVVPLVLTLVLCFAASAAAQPIGPFCLEPTIGKEIFSPFVIFALPMGSSQFLLSAEAALPFSGAASLGRNGLLFFTLLAGTPFPGPAVQGAAALFSGVLNLEAGAGQGTCSFLNSPTLEPSPQCGTNTPVTYALVSCGGLPPA
jgi:hypothetical protein